MDLIGEFTSQISKIGGEKVTTETISNDDD